MKLMNLLHNSFNLCFCVLVFLSAFKTFSREFLYLPLNIEN